MPIFLLSVRGYKERARTLVLAYFTADLPNPLFTSCQPTPKSMSSFSPTKDGVGYLTLLVSFLLNLTFFSRSPETNDGHCG